MPQDISTREDVVLLVDTFYDKIKVNPVIGYIFNDVAKTDWDKHLPKMYSFWSSLLLGEHSYSGNPMATHIELSKLTPLTEKEFAEWLVIFTQTVDELFAGPNANDAKTRAGNIAGLMSHKISTFTNPQKFL